ncbi:signal peptidase I [Anaerosacchariphilus polymeriproducens]|nr:signal peptidase I [Anaerosacchariphilus polymeriproducens]
MDIKVNRKELFKEILSYAKIIVGTFLIVFILNTCIIANAQVPTGSMETTVMTGDRIIINRLAYKFEEPHRGDIVSFIFPDDGKTPYLKRVIGLPGETIEGKNGDIYINGELLKANYTDEKSYDDFGPYKIPDKSYFMMGDNRNNSFDARYWNNKFVKLDDIIGKALVSYFPHPRILK